MYEREEAGRKACVWILENCTQIWSRQMNPLLDTVEPDAWAREWEGDDSDLGQYCVVFHEDEKDNNPNWFTLYSRPKMEEHIESLLSQCRKEARKEALLEAAAKIETYWEANAREFAEELRRMAEGEKK